MPFAPRVHVEGLHELNRDFGRLSKELQKELQKELRTLAEPVAADIRRRAEAEHWGPKTISGIAAGSRYGQAIVRQRRKKTTRKRPDFGSLQMRKAFIPGATEMEPVVYKGVEVMLGRLTSERGFGPVGGVIRK